MAKSTKQKASGARTGDRERHSGTPRPRGNAVTDYLDASEPLHRGGFEERPQPELSGSPLSGSVSDWAEQIAGAAESHRISPLEGERSPKATEGVATKGSATASVATGVTPPGGLAATLPSRGRGASAKPSKRIPERSSAPTKTARGTSMGGAASAKERAAAGLNPVAGLDISLEDAESLANSGVTAKIGRAHV